MRKKDNKDWLLIALLALALLGKGPLATPRPPAPDTTSPDKPGVDPGTNGKSSDSTTPDSSTPKSSPPDPRLTGGVPDKSKMQSSPGTMGMPPTFMMPGPFDNPGVMFAQNQVNLINSQPKTPEGPGTFLVSNLGGTPGASVTTALYNPVTMMYDTFTNNQYLFTPKAPGMSPMEMLKQPTPMMMQPMTVPLPAVKPPMMSSSIIPVPTVKSPFDPNVGILQPNTPIPLSGLVDPNTLPGSTNPLSALMKMLMPNMVMDSTPGLSYPGTNIPNPLSSKTTLPLQDLLNQFGGFGQNALNQFLNAGNNLQGIFNNLQGLAIPSVPGARPILPDIVV